MTTQVHVADEGLSDDVCYELNCTPLNKSYIQVLTWYLLDSIRKEVIAYVIR